MHWGTVQDLLTIEVPLWAFLLALFITLMAHSGLQVRFRRERTAKGLMALSSVCKDLDSRLASLERSPPALRAPRTPLREGTRARDMAAPQFRSGSVFGPPGNDEYVQPRSAMAPLLHQERETPFRQPADDDIFVDYPERELRFPSPDLMAAIRS